MPSRPGMVILNRQFSCEEREAMKSKTTWVLIADGARARLVSAVGHDKTLHVVEQCEFKAAHQANRDLERDKPARVFESHGATRHAIEAKVDPHRELKRSFAQEIAEALEDSLAKKHFDRLVIAAAPITLGDLRSAMSDNVKNSVIAEIAMDLTKVPNSDVPRHIEGLIPV
jgi:protein required for attachment to host cells